MIYECNVYCHSTPPDLEDILGKSADDDGKWLPFAVDLSLIDAIKMSSDESDSFTYKCTTLFMSSGDTYAIDTKYKDFLKIWKDYKHQIDIIDDDDLEL
jgi:hypothetical protein